MGFVEKGQPISTEKARALIAEDLTSDEASEFLAVLRECVKAVADGKVAEVDLTREVEERGSVTITLRRDPFTAS